MKSLLCLLLFSLAAFADAQDRIQKVVDVKNGNVDAIFRAVHTLSGDIVYTSEGNHILLSGNKASVEGVEAVIRQLDVPLAPTKNIELSVSMIAGSAQPSGGAPLPASLAAVAKQMAGVFVNKNFQLLDTFVLRLRDGQGGENNGFIRHGDETSRMTYTFRVGRLRVENSGIEPSIRLDSLILNVRVPVKTSQAQTGFAEASIRTDVDIRPGQSVVVGKTSALDAPDGALFLVISARALD